MENQRIKKKIKGQPQSSSPRTTPTDTRGKDTKVKDRDEGKA